MKDRSAVARRILMLLALVGLAVSAYAQSGAVELTDQARQLIVDRQYEQALAKLDAAVAEDAELPQAHYFRGVALGSLGREREAVGAFVRAGELSPGWGDAHRLAALAALTVRDLQVAWDQAIKAHQAGADVADTLNHLLAMEKAPPDLNSQLAAARVFVMPLNTEKLAAREDNPWGVDVVAGGRGGGIVDPFNSSATRATNVGGQQITQSQSDFFNLLAQTRRSLSNSRMFGVVPRQEMAQFLLVIEVDRIGDTQKSLDGYLKLYDPRSGEEIYRRVLELRNIASLAELNADMERYVDYMEEWLRKRTG